MLVADGAGVPFNSIGNAGAKPLAEALKSNGALKSLDLRENSIGVAAQAAIDAVLAVKPEKRPQAFAAEVAAAEKERKAARHEL